MTRGTQSYVVLGGTSCIAESPGSTNSRAAGGNLLLTTRNESTAVDSRSNSPVRPPSPVRMIPLQSMVLCKWPWSDLGKSMAL